MNEIQFAESALPQTVECLGLVLKPYGIRCELILLKQGNAFLCLPQDGFDKLAPSRKIQELVRGVLVCAETYPKWIRVWRWRQRGATEAWNSAALAIADFRNYISEGRALMKTLSSENAEDKEAYEVASKGEKLEGGRSYGSPMIAHLIKFGIHELNLTHDETIDAPMGYIGNLYLAHLESKGAVAVENADEIKARADLEDARAVVRAEKEAARKAWAACNTDEERHSAFEKHPRIGNLFAEEWNAAKNDEEKAGIENKWPMVAGPVLKQSGLKGITVCQD